VGVSMDDKIVYLKDKRNPVPKAPRLRLILLGILVLLVTKVLSSLVGGGIGSKTVAVRLDSLEEKVSVDTYAIRREITYYAPAGGYLTTLVQEGQRVAAGGIVCEIKAEQDTGLSERLNQTREAIAEVETKYNQLINQKQNALLSVDNAVEGETLRQEIEELEETRDRELEKLVAGLQEIFDELVSSVNVVRIDGPGVVSFFVNPGEPLDLLELEALNQLSPKAVTGVRWVHTDGQRVLRGQPIFRVVDNFRFYLLLSLEEPVALSENKKVVVTWPKLGSQVEAVVVKTLENGGVLLEPKQFLPEFIIMVYEPGELILDTYTGSVVPVEALVYQEDRLGVYVSTDTGPVFRPVDLLYNDGRQAVIEGVAPGNYVKVR